MTKKDYIKFADMIARNKAQAQESPNSYLTIGAIQDDMIVLFKLDNPAFDAARFNAYIDKRVKELTGNG